MVETCPNCKTLMKVRRERGHTYLSCDKCHHAKPLEKTTMKETMKHDKEVEVVHDTIHPLAVTPHKCSKCGFDKAMTISKGIWYSDEDEVIEYVCGRCGYHEKDPDQKIT